MINLLNHGPFGTHRPALIEIIKNTEGDILECGCGNSSTILIKELIKNTDRKLVSLESNKEWLDKYMNLEDNNHKLFFIDAGNDDTDNTAKTWINFIENNDYIKNLNLEVCFIDQSPWTARTYTLNYFKNKCKMLIVHDVDYFPGHGKWGRILNRLHTNNNNIFKYEMDFSDIIKNFKVYYPPEQYFAGPSGPSTLVCSEILSKNEFDKITSTIDYNKTYGTNEPSIRASI